MTTTLNATWRALAVLATALVLTACERLPMQSTQLGYRGTGMVQIDNPRILAAQAAARPALPASTPVAPTEGPKAKDVYQNVKVLGDLPVAEFTRHMLAITQWVAPEQGCAYCHGANFADDGKYTKVVARRMIEMTQNLNANWKQHTGVTGVTCYTCHRGNPEPKMVWHTAAAPRNAGMASALGNDAGQNKMDGPGLSSLPYEPFSSYLLGTEEIKVNGKAALPPPGRDGPAIQQAEKTYALMMHFSKSLGTNCTTCHNTQSFTQWVPKKMTASHGIRMARDINNNYLVPLTSTFPADKLGPGGDVAKVFCATCHQGQNKPLGGLEMAKLYPGLTAQAAAAAGAAAAPTAMAAAPAAGASAPAR